MAVVPFSVVPTVAPDARPPSDYQTEQASPASFGSIGAQELEQSGRNLQNAGAQGLDATIALQTRYNQIAVQDAYNQLEKGYQNLTYGDPNDPTQKGFYALHGKDALDAYPTTRAALDSQRETILGGLQNPAQRLAFESASRRIQYYTESAIGRHADEQTNVYGAVTAQSQLDIAQQSAGLNYNDPQKITDAAVNARNGAISLIKMRAGQGDIDPAIVQDAMTKADAGTVLRAVRARAATDPAGAAEMLQTWTLPGHLPGEKPIPYIDTLDAEQKESILKPLLDEAQKRADMALVSGLISQSQGKPSGGVAPDIAGTITQRAQMRGLDPSIALTTAKLESSGGNAPDAPGNPHQGVFQLGPKEWASIGGTAANRGDRTAQAQLGTDWVAGAQRAASVALGRPAVGWETYIVHQQGTEGGKDLLQAPPDSNVVTALTPAYGGDRTKAVQAITNNGGNASMTTGQFLTLWQTKYQAASGGVSPVGASVTQASYPGQGSPANDAFPDESAIVQKIQQMVPDPIHQQKLIADVRSQIGTMRLATQTERDDLVHSLPNLQAAALGGKEITVPEQQIRHLLPPADAAREIETLDIYQQAGQSFKAVRWGTPQEVAAEYDRLSADLGTPRGRSAGTGPTWNGIPTVEGAAGGPSVGGSDLGGPNADIPAQYALREKIRDAFQAAIVKRNADLKDDVAGYVSQNPVLLAKAAAIDPQNPLPGMQDYFRASLSVQSSLGVAPQNQHLLSKGQAQQRATAISGSDPSTTDAGAALVKMAKDFGPYWGQAFGDMKTLGKLSPQYQTLAMINDPVTRSDFQSMLKSASEDKSGVQKLHDLAGTENMRDINQNLDGGVMRDFKRSANIPGLYNNVEGIEGLRDGVRNLAAYYTIRGENTGAQAVTKAMDSIIGNKYDFDGYLRVPKGQMAPIENYAGAMKDNLRPEDLATVQGRSVPGIEASPDTAINERVQRDIVAPIQGQAASDAFDEIHRTGKWATSENDNGAFLVAQDRNGLPYIVKKADGSRVEFSFPDAIKGAPPAQRTAPASTSSFVP